MSVPAGTEASARLIAFGSDALVAAFALIGFECYGDASAATVDTILEELLRTRSRAFVVLEHPLARSAGPLLRKVRAESASIVVIEVPSLHSPLEHRPAVEDLLRRVLGPAALEDVDAR